MTTDKKILDACCGSRMMWFDKKNPAVIYADKRNVNFEGVCNISPDVVHDCTQMDFPDESFHVVAMDLPQEFSANETSIIGKKYGKLPKDWVPFVKNSVNESMRVLKQNGLLVFKWNERCVTLKQVLAAIDHSPLFGHTSDKHGKTKWLVFMKGNSEKVNNNAPTTAG